MSENPEKRPIGFGEKSLWEISGRYTVAGIVLLQLFVSSVAAQIPPDPSESQKKTPLPIDLVNRLPARYRQAAMGNIVPSVDFIKDLRADTDDDLTQAVLDWLGNSSETADFLAQQLITEPSAKFRLVMIRGLSTFWKSHPAQQVVLEHLIESDPDATVSLEALETLRHTRLAYLRDLLERHLESQGVSSTNDRARLADAEERWYSLVGGQILPDFLRKTPPVFQVASSAKFIRAIAIGDFGDGSEQQKRVGEAMQRYRTVNHVDFGLTLGDNFYENGVSSTDDPQWNSKWESIYGGLHLTFYPVFGNHDWEQPDSPAAEIIYSATSANWRMPAPYYSFVAGPAQFFAIDTVELGKRELAWLESELSRSRSRWKIVYGHHHIYSATRGNNDELVEQLLPILKKNQVDVYLCGHDHNLQELRNDGSVHFFIDGAGGGTLYATKSYDRSLFKSKSNGFAVLEADVDHLTVRFIGVDGGEIHRSTITK